MITLTLAIKTEFFGNKDVERLYAIIQNCLWECILLQNLQSMNKMSITLTYAEASRYRVAIFKKIIMQVTLFKSMEIRNIPHSKDTAYLSGSVRIKNKYIFEQSA